MEGCLVVDFHFSSSAPFIQAPANNPGWRVGRQGTCTIRRALPPRLAHWSKLCNVFFQIGIIRAKNGKSTS